MLRSYEHLSPGQRVGSMILKPHGILEQESGHPRRDRMNGGITQFVSNIASHNSNLEISQVSSEAGQSI